MLKRNIVVLFLSLITVVPLFAQKFTKKEQLRREAREANFFYGSAFTITGGYNYSWMSDKEIDLDSEYFGKSERWGQHRNGGNAGLQYDYALNRKWGLQAGLFYSVKGGDHTYYYDEGLGYGAKLKDELTEEAVNQMVELQIVGRYFIPTSKLGRISLNAGYYIDRVIKSGSGLGKWDMGLQAGIGYDWYHTALSVTYQHSVFPPYVEDSKSMQNAIYVNIGYRLWK